MVARARGTGEWGIVAGQYGDQIAKRVQHILGPEWTVGSVRFNEPYFFVTPEAVGREPEREPLMIMWEAEDEAGVAMGAGKVFTVGAVMGKDVSADAPLDEVLAKVVEAWQARKDKKRRGLFSR